jgi:hypothetical protein
MKKMLPFLNWFFVKLFQLFLLYLSIEAFDKAKEFGDSVKSFDSNVYNIDQNGIEKYINANSIAVTSGYNGGAVAMGLISCTTLFLIVWIEVVLYKKKNENMGISN